MNIREFKAKYMARLMEIRKQISEKYPDRSDRAQYISDLLIVKLRSLRTFTLADYLATLYDAVKEFKELEALIPSEKEIKALLKSPDLDQ
jgi:hypothetical protein